MYILDKEKKKAWSANAKMQNNGKKRRTQQCRRILVWCRMLSDKWCWTTACRPLGSRMVLIKRED